jgi:hypothetical protein
MRPLPAVSEAREQRGLAKKMGRAPISAQMQITQGRQIQRCVAHGPEAADAALRHRHTRSI